MNRTIAIVGIVGVVLLVAGVYSAGQSAGQEAGLKLAAEARAAETPVPTPPLPTPRIIEREVEVTVEIPVVPRACTNAFDTLLRENVDLLEFATGVLGDYYDYPDENLIDFGRRVEDRLGSLPNNFDEDLDYGACR